VQTREALAEAKEKVEQQEKEIEQRMRKQMEAYIKEHHDDSKKEQEERKEIVGFIEKKPVNDVFTNYEKSLTYMHKFYAS
jgi:hypothetical protein